MQFLCNDVHTGGKLCGARILESAALNMQNIHDATPVF